MANYGPLTEPFEWPLPTRDFWGINKKPKLGNSTSSLDQFHSINDEEITRPNNRRHAPEMSCENTQIRELFFLSIKFTDQFMCSKKLDHVG